MNYHNITHDDMLNGEGLRVVLWVSGCEHRCLNCHNKRTWDIDSGIPFDTKAKEEIFDYLSRDYISGITFSGGDPFNKNNIKLITELVKEIKAYFPTKTIWVYTGYLWEDIKNQDIISLIDIIVDGKFVEQSLDSSLHWVGSSNQRIIDVKKTIASGEIILCDMKG